MERAEPSKKALDPAQREQVRQCIDKSSAASVAMAWGISRFALGQAALGYEVTAGTRSLIQRGLESEAK